MRECYGKNVKCKLEREKEMPIIYVGSHLIIDLWGAVNLDDDKVVKSTIRALAGHEEGWIHLERDEDCITGGIMLPGMHINIHSWPKVNYAAVDILTSKEIDANKVAHILKDAFEPTRIVTQELQRGIKD